MTLPEIAEMLESTGLPVAYDHYAEGESPTPPFLVFLFPNSSNFSADNGVYVKIDELYIELYTDIKDPASELLVENALDACGFFYNKDEMWIPEERLYEVLYMMEVIRNVQ